VLATGADVVPLAPVPSEGPRVRDARDGGGLALAATLAAAGSSVCILVNDLAPRCGEILGTLDASRFAGSEAVLLPWRLVSGARDARAALAVETGPRGDRASRLRSPGLAAYGLRARRGARAARARRGGRRTARAAFDRDDAPRLRRA